MIYKSEKTMLNYAYCSDKYQYTMGKSFYDSGMKDQTAVFMAVVSVISKSIKS